MIFIIYLLVIKVVNNGVVLCWLELDGFGTITLPYSYHTFNCGVCACSFENALSAVNLISVNLTNLKTNMASINANGYINSYSIWTIGI